MICLKVINNYFINTNISILRNKIVIINPYPYQTVNSFIHNLANKAMSKWPE